MLVILFAVLALSLIGVVGAYSNLTDYYSSINYSCNQDSDCAVKNIDPCCNNNYKCLNKDNFNYNLTSLKSLCGDGQPWGCAAYAALLPDYCKCENNKCVEKECPKYSPPAPDWCKNGTIVPGIQDENGCIGHPTCIENSTTCKSLYWFDNDNKNCSQKQFCGAYMYLGLYVFENKDDCERVLNKNCSELKLVWWYDSLLNECRQINSSICVPTEFSTKEECENNSGQPLLKIEYNNYASKYSLKYATYDEAVQAFQEVIGDESILPQGYLVRQNELYFYSDKTIVESGGKFGELGDCIGYRFNLITGKLTSTENACKFTGGESKTCPEGATDEDGKCMYPLSNGRKAEIKIMPETASATAIAKLGELNFIIELKEVGKGDDVKVVYELTGNKQGKFLGIFKIIARVQVQVDAETGDVKVIKPWWSFLASGV